MIAPVSEVAQMHQFTRKLRQRSVAGAVRAYAGSVGPMPARTLRELFAPMVPTGPLSINLDLTVACKKLQIPNVTPNDLRRTCMTWLRAEGVLPSEIAPCR